jgi:hypothetical protein
MIGNPALIGSNSSNAGIVSLAAAGCVVPANSLVVVVLSISNASTDPGSGAACSDGTNALQVDANQLRISERTVIFSRYYAAGATLTFTASSFSSDDTFIRVYSTSGAATSSWFDTVGGTSTGSSAQQTTQTNANVAQVDSLAIFAISRHNGTAWSSGYPPTGYTSEANLTDGVRNRGLAVAYHNQLTAGAKESAVWTPSATTDQAAALVVYKGLGITTVTKTLTAAYNVRQSIVKTLTPSYTVRKIVLKFINTSGNSISYLIRNLVTKTLTPAYTVVARVGKSLTPAYNVRAFPKNLIAPSISGVPVSGEILTGDLGTWRDTVQLTQKWKVETAPGSNVFEDIPGETDIDLQV